MSSVKPSEVIRRHQFVQTELRWCTQHQAKVAKNEGPGQTIISKDKLTQRWICGACSLNNKRKLAALFSLPEEVAFEL